jgi:hypothetical protein
MTIIKAYNWAHSSTKWLREKFDDELALTMAALTANVRDAEDDADESADELPAQWTSGACDDEDGGVFGVFCVTCTLDCMQPGAPSSADDLPDAAQARRDDRVAYPADGTPNAPSPQEVVYGVKSGGCMSAHATLSHGSASTGGRRPQLAQKSALQVRVEGRGVCRVEGESHAWGVLLHVALQAGELTVIVCLDPH